LVGVTSTGMDELTLTTWMDVWEEGRLGLAILGLDNSCFAFFP